MRRFARVLVVTAMLLSLTDSNGVSGATSVPLLEALEIAQGQTATVHFDASPLPAGHQAVLRFWARLDTKTVAGYTQCLRLVFNEQTLSGERLMNKKLRVKSRAGQVSSMYAGERLTVFYAPDFDSPTDERYVSILYWGREHGQAECGTLDANFLFLAHKVQPVLAKKGCIMAQGH